MANQREALLDGRERRRLRLARENAWLDTRGQCSQRVRKAYGLWCWKLRIPMVWLERLTPHSRYGRVRLDMMTTSQVLTAAGQAAVGALAAVSGAREQAKVSPHDAALGRVPLGKLDKLAHEVYRAATAAGNFKPNKSEAAETQQRQAPKVVRIPQKAAS
jgi:hypothetical protein